METVVSWLNRPFIPGSFLRIWMGVAALAVLLALVIVLLIHRKRRKTRNVIQNNEGMIEWPKQLPPLELANLQGIGAVSYTHLDVYKRQA